MTRNNAYKNKNAKINIIINKIIKRKMENEEISVR